MNTLRRSLGKNSAVRQFLSRAVLCAALSLPFVAIGPAAGRSAAKSGGSPVTTTVTPVPPWFAGAKAWLRTRRSRRSTCCTRSRTTPVPLPWMIRR